MQRQTRQRILEAAYGLFYAKGFARVSLDVVAETTGVTKRTLYYHFATKDELLIAVLDENTERVREQLGREEHVTRRGEIDVTSLVAHLWEVYGDPGYWAIWEINIGTRADPALHRKVVEHRVWTMQQVLHPWITRHILSRDGKPTIIALFEFMLIAIRGLSLERFLDKEDAYFEQHLALLADMVSRKLASLTAMP